jgi:hypothetical protein
MFREYSDRGMAFNTLRLVAPKLYRDSNKFLPDFISGPTWTCCSSMHYLILTTYNHTIFCNKTKLPLRCGSPERPYLDNSFPGRGISKNNPLPWPPCSPYIPPMGFFMWDYFKRTVYQLPFVGTDDLMKRSHK